ACIPACAGMPEELHLSSDRSSAPGQTIEQQGSLRESPTVERRICVGSKSVQGISADRARRLPMCCRKRNLPEERHSAVL
ncbi:MAG: hypothetical protein ACK58T_18685, partial [Phycisphaerae bacterium]